MSETIHDPENYRAMSEPFASADEANEALNKFYAGVRELRNKHRIAEVLVVTVTNVVYESGEGRAMSLSFGGDQENAESMAAWAYGKTSAERREKISRLLSGKDDK